MRSAVVGLMIGVVCGSAATLLFQALRAKWVSADVSHSMQVLEAAPLVLEEALPGSKVLDTSVLSPSSHEVAYEHEALYDVNITYQRGRLIKRISVPFGFATGVLVTPNVSQMVIADDRAEIIHELSEQANAR